MNIKCFLKYWKYKYIYGYKYRSFEEWADEGFFISSFHKKTTGLSVNLVIDENNYYVDNGYPRCLKFQTNTDDELQWANLGIMTIEDEPRVIKGEHKASEEIINTVKGWIKKYKEDLIDIERVQTSGKLRDKLMDEQLILIPKDKSGLPVNVWVDTISMFIGMNYGDEHSHVIRFQTNTEDQIDFEKTGKMTIGDEPILVYVRCQFELSDNEMSMITTWIKKYKNELIEVSKKRISFDDFLNKTFFHKEDWCKFVI
jgi:hypothetical protein